MSHIRDFLHSSSGIPHTIIMLASILTLLAFAVYKVILDRNRFARECAFWIRLVLPVFLLALAVRLMAPFGPHVAKGRDYLTFEAVYLSTSLGPYDRLLVLLYWLPERITDVFVAIRFGQAFLGAAGASLIASLVYLHGGGTLASYASGFLAAITPALFRVDASVSPEVELRFFLLAALVLETGWRRGRSWTYLAAIGACLVLMSYTRPEALLISYVFLGMLAGGEVQGKRMGPSVALLLSMVLVAYVWLPGAAIAGLLFLLWSWRGARCLDRTALVFGIILTAVLAYQAVEVISAGREVMHRLEPATVLGIASRRNILLRWEFCSPFILVLSIAGIFAARTAARSLLGVLLFLGLPLLVFYLVFLGDVSAIMKLQGIGLAILLPFAGIGAEWTYERLAGTGRAWMGIAALGGVLAVTALMSLPGLLEKNLMQQEFEFLRSHRGCIHGGLRIIWATEAHGYPATPATKVLLDGNDAEVMEAGKGDELPPAAPDILVYLPASCYFFRDGEKLPGINRSPSDMLMRDMKDMSAIQVLAALWDIFDAFGKSLKKAGVKERELCSRLRKAYRLCPYLETTGVSSRFDGYLVSQDRVRFGYYKPCP